MSKTVVAVIVYNRFHNIQEWVKCWHKSNTKDCELVIIHNYRNDFDKKQYKAFCEQNGVTYLSRPNVGFDIGAFQDLCNNRLQFPYFDYLLWCTDDLLPCRPSFIQEYLHEMTEGIICAAYEVSIEVHPHIRTTGFMLHKSTLPKIKFNVDPIRTKPDCYDFEHRDKQNSLIDQVSRFGKVVQVGDLDWSPMWDSGHNSREAIRRRNKRVADQKRFA
jgi:hypothetical protein